jgi:flagellar motor switch protein FliM
MSDELSQEELDAMLSGGPAASFPSQKDPEPVVPGFADGPLPPAPYLDFDSPHVLNQTEIDRLLSGAYAAAAEDAIKGTSLDVHGTPRKHVKLYDFHRPDKLSKEQLRTLTVLHQNFARLISSTLSANIRCPVQTTLMFLEQKLYKEYTEEIAQPTVLNVVALDPLPGRAIIELGLDIGFLVADRLLGGPGKPMPPGRVVTEIEISLMKTIVNSLLYPLKETWLTVIELHPRLEDTTLQTQFVQIALPTDVVIQVAFEIRLLGMVGTVSMCIPHSALEPIIPHLSAEVWLSNKQKQNNDDQQQTLREHLERSRLPVSVRLGETFLSVRDLLELQPGDVMSLDGQADKPLVIAVEERAKFYGRPGVLGSRLAVQITDVIGEADDEPFA